MFLFITRTVNLKKKLNSASWPNSLGSLKGPHLCRQDKKRVQQYIVVSTFISFIVPSLKNSFNWTRNVESVVLLWLSIVSPFSLFLPFELIIILSNATYYFCLLIMLHIDFLYIYSIPLMIFFLD